MRTRRHKLLQGGRERRRIRVRAVIHGTVARPRLAVFRSNRYLYAQLIDDQVGKTIVAVREAEIAATGTPMERAAALGELLAKKATAKKLTRVVFDRRGYQYHGRIKALADGARKGGLAF